MVHFLISLRVQNLGLPRVISTSIPVSKLHSLAFSYEHGGKVPLIQDLEVKYRERLAAFRSLFFREDTPPPLKLIVGLTRVESLGKSWRRKNI